MNCNGSGISIMGEWKQPVAMWVIELGQFYTKVHGGGLRSCGCKTRPAVQLVLDALMNCACPCPGCRDESSLRRL